MPLLQVDMKIMYYELIKMLIDYERKNHPESYDATKTVGKIEGYQVQDIYCNYKVELGGENFHENLGKY